MTRIPLGPFDLETPIGRGGMAEVWGGWHRATQTAVAVKVLNPKWSDSTLGLRLFQREVQTFARLQHPGIVAVYDHGEISTATEASSNGALQAGSPYLVSEYVGGGNLAASEAVSDWPQLRSTLFSILDSLAHAHARGVIHRDLKPANILRVQASRRVKLTDFGIVHVIGQQNVSGAGGKRARFVGTPSFASPEQIQADLPEVGPWTDLYALACTLYVLATGQPPYGTTRTVGREALLNAHVADPPPPLEARFSVPDGLEAWAHRLLRKDPKHRYRWAADAAAGLLALDQDSFPASDAEEMDLLGESTGTLTFVVPEAVRLGLGGDLDFGYDDPTVLTPMAAALFKDGSETVRDVHAMEELDVGENVTTVMTNDRPDMPADWRQPHFPQQVLHDAGLSIYGMRPIPLVGREAERDRLWSLLQFVVSTGRLKTVLLDGTAGTGKSRLARWLCERAHEVGAASVMTIRHDSSQVPWEGLQGLLLEAFNCQGMRPREVRDRVIHVLREGGERGGEEIAALCEFMAPMSDVEESSYRFWAPQERYALIDRVIERRCADRPTVLWIDDAQWGEESLGLVRHLERGNSDRQMPLLVVMTVRTDVDAEDMTYTPVMSRTLPVIPASTRLEVEALPESEWPLLVSAVLGMEGPLVADVARRCAGNPLFTMQMIGDWVQRGVLVSGRDGWRLASDGEGKAPEDLAAIWEKRMAHLLARRPSRDGDSLELAALLGHQVDEDLWRSVCEMRGLEPALDAVASMMRRGLAQPVFGALSRWEFSHGMVRECLFERARTEGRLQDHHRACARLFDGSGERVLDPSRLGRHLVGAGDLVEALEPLLSGAQSAFDSGDIWEAEGLLTSHKQVLKQLNLEGVDVRWARGRTLEAKMVVHRGDFGVGERIATEAEDIARAHGWAEQVIECLHIRARAATRRGEVHLAQALLKRALELAQEGGFVELRAVLLRHVTYVSLWSGDIKLARRAGAEALQIFESLQEGARSELGLARHLRMLARIELSAGRLDAAAGYLSEAMERMESDGDRPGLATCHNTLGEIARLRGDLDAAEVHYLEAVRRYEAVGSVDGVWVQANLALVWTCQGRYDEAGELLHRLLTRSKGEDDRPLRIGVYSHLVACSAGQGRWDDFAEHLAAQETLQGESPLVEPDIALGMEEAGRIAAEKGRELESRAAYLKALEQWRSLGREEDEARVERALLELA